MWKLRIGALVTSGLLGLSLTPIAAAAKAGDPNAGDVWVDNHGQPGGPGHEMDPHLACADIDLWGSGLADASSNFTIDGWPPSGSQTVAYSGTWSYTQSGDQVIASIGVAKLIAQAEANGDRATAQGFHFKLEFSQDPQKHKTFWIDCPASSPGGGGSTPGGGGGSTPGGTTDPGTVSTPPVTTASTGPVRTAVGGVGTARKRVVTHKHKLVHPKRHRRIRRRHVKAVRLKAPSFTG